MHLPAIKAIMVIFSTAELRRLKADGADKSKAGCALKANDI